MKRLVLLLAVVLVVASWGCANGELPPDPPGDPQDQEPPSLAETELAAIVNGDVVLLDDNGDIRQVTEFGDVSALVWSPDGSRLLVYREGNGELWLTAADGSDLRLLAENVIFDINGELPGYIWHPDGHRLAYACWDRDVLHIIDIADDFRQSFSLPDPYRSGPWWAPAGQGLAVVLAREREEQGYDYDQDIAIPGPNYVALFSPEGQLLYSRPGSVRPVWAGENLVFIIYVESVLSGYIGSVGLAAIDARGNPLWELTELEPQNLYPLSSGQRMVFADPTHLYVVEVASATFSQLAEQDLYITFSEFSYPFWFLPAHAADKVAALEFSRLGDPDDFPQTGLWDLVIYDLDGNQEWTVWAEVYRIEEFEYAVPLGWDQPMFWSRDGEKLFVLQGDAEQKEIWALAAAGGSPPSLLLENCWLVSSRPRQ